MLKVYIQVVQLEDDTYKRIKEKLEKGVKQDYKIMLAYCNRRMPVRGQQEGSQSGRVHDTEAIRWGVRGDSKQSDG